MAAMAWFITGTVGEFLAAAGEFLRADPARNSVALTVEPGPHGLGFTGERT